MGGNVNHLTPIHQDPHSGMYHAKEGAYFEIPITIYNASTTRYRLSEILYESLTSEIRDQSKDESGITEIKVSEDQNNATNYETELVNLIDRAQLKEPQGKDSKEQTTLYNGYFWFTILILFLTRL